MDRRITAGRVALAAVGLLVSGAFIGLALEAARQGSGVLDAFDAWLLRIARFTLWQALLSTLLSVLPSILLARALARHPAFPGRAAPCGKTGETVKEVPGASCPMPWPI